MLFWFAIRLRRRVLLQEGEHLVPGIQSTVTTTSSPDVLSPVDLLDIPALFEATADDVGVALGLSPGVQHILRCALVVGGESNPDREISELATLLQGLSQAVRDVQIERGATLHPVEDPGLHDEVEDEIIEDAPTEEDGPQEIIAITNDTWQRYAEFFQQVFPDDLADDVLIDPAAGEKVLRSLFGVLLDKRRTRMNQTTATEHIMRVQKWLGIQQRPQPLEAIAAYESRTANAVWNSIRKAAELLGELATDDELDATFHDMLEGARLIDGSLYE